MDPLLLTAIGSVFAVGVSFYSVMQVRKSAKDSSHVEQNKIDAQAFQRARENYEASIQQLEQQVARLKRSLDDVREEKYIVQSRLLKCESQLELFRQLLQKSNLLPKDYGQDY